MKFSSVGALDCYYFIMISDVVLLIHAINIKSQFQHLSPKEYAKHNFSWPIIF